MGKSEDKKSFQLYNDNIDHFSLMSDEESGKLIKAIFCYVNDLPCEELAGLPLMAFSFIRSQLKRDCDKYDARCEINRRNGKLGGRPKKVQTEEPKKPDGMEETQSVLDIPGIEMAEEKAPEQEVPQEPPKKPKKTEYSTDFQRFWRIYPRKDGKGEAYKKYKARLNDGWSPDELCEAAENYKKKLVRERTESKYIKHAKTFLSENTPFEDFLNKRENNRVEESQEDEGNPFRKNGGIADGGNSRIVHRICREDCKRKWNTAGNDARGRLYRGRSYPLRKMQREKTDQSKNPRR